MKIQNYSINSFIPIKKSSVAYVEKQKQIESEIGITAYNKLTKVTLKLDWLNPQTGEITIFIVWVVAVMAIIYSVWYFKRVKES